VRGKRLHKWKEGEQSTTRGPDTVSKETAMAGTRRALLRFGIACIMGMEPCCPDKTQARYDNSPDAGGTASEAP
jgi:hypothetical protein